LLRDGDLTAMQRTAASLRLSARFGDTIPRVVPTGRALYSRVVMARG
jgi:hypothetical protein